MMKINSLIKAVKTANLSQIEALIKEGVDLNQIDIEENPLTNTWTALHHCIFQEGTRQDKKYTEVAKLLLNHGCKTNIKNAQHENALEFAIKFFALDILDLMIQKGADINETERNLYDVILNRYYFERELDKRHLNEMKNKEEKTASKKGEGESLRRMYQRIDALVKNGYDLNRGEYSAALCTILEIHSNQLPAKVLLYLFQKGANPLEYLSSESQKKYPLFDEACYQKLPNEILVEYAKIIGINSVFTEPPNDTPLTIAIKNNNLNLTRELIRLGANLHHDHEHALKLACSKGFIEIVKCLVENGASIDGLNTQELKLIEEVKKNEF